MCNLYDHDPRQLDFGDVDGWLQRPSKHGDRVKVYPDRMAPVVRLDSAGELKTVEMRWGFPPPPTKGGTRPVTNVRNTASSYWRPWLKPEQRCLVPATSFAEWTDTRPARERWFSRPGDLPFFFAGIWRPWTGVRGTKSAPVEGEHLLYSFLTTNANGVVRPVHRTAMPVVLTTPQEVEMWLHAPTDVALALQRPLPERELQLAA